MNRNEAMPFKELLSGVYSFYRQELTDFHREVWWLAMRPYPLDAVRDALNRHLMNPDNGQFLPKPADIVKLVDGGTADQALQAWTKFELAVSHVGSYETVVFDDPIIHAVASDMGGWVRLCLRDIGEWPFVKNEFVTRYRAYAMKPLMTYPAKLIGQAESSNTAQGQPVALPLFVGDESMARKVMLNGADAQHALHGRRIGELLVNSTSQLLASK